MNRMVCAITFLLLSIGNSASVPYSLVEGFKKNGAASEKGEKKDPVKTVTCDWVSGAGLDDTKLDEDNAIKLALYEAVVSGKGVVKAKKDCATFEGDPLPVYATAKGGKIKITRDYSQDRRMSFKGLIKSFGGNSYSTRKVEIGYLEQGKFISLNGGASDGRRLFLRLKGKEYF
jgi:hypothetical protein